MSVVTNVILSGFAGCRPDFHRTVVDALNAFLSQRESPLGELAQVDQHAGGRKAIECYVWMGAFNYLEIGEFVDVYQKSLGTITDPQTRPQLLLKRQDDDKFYEVPNKDDYRTWHYREAALDVLVVDE